MNDQYHIDSHKLVFHPGRVAHWFESHEKWESAKSVYPIYLEVSPIGICNHRCLFCALDFVGYQNVGLNEDIFKKRLSEMAKLGIKSIMFAGEGEPTLWKPLGKILELCSKIGIDTALTTNMVPFNENNTDIILRNCRWIKTSINAGTPETYALIHGTKSSDFERVMANFKRCVTLRRRKHYTCTIGAQLLLLPENAHEVFSLGRQLKSIGIDYFVVKPYSQHPSSITKRYAKVDYASFSSLGEKLETLNSGKFKVIFRRKTMEKLVENEKGYRRCCSTPFFWAYIMADGSVYGCSVFLGDKKFYYGNIHQSSFKNIWEGARRKKSYEFVKNSLDARKCRKNCRMDEINRYLWKLKNPDAHVNFI